MTRARARQIKQQVNLLLHDCIAVNESFILPNVSMFLVLRYTCEAYDRDDDQVATGQFCLLNMKILTQREEREAGLCAIKVLEDLPRTWETSITCPSRIQAVPHPEDEDKKDPVRVGLDFAQPDTPGSILP